MRLLFAVYFIASVLAPFAVLSDARQQSCTANHCGEITKAIRTLGTKVNNLIAMVKDALPSKPTGTFPMIFWDTAFTVFMISQHAQILKWRSYFSHSRSLLLLQGTVPHRKVSTEQSVIIARFQITCLMRIHMPFW